MKIAASFVWLNPCRYDNTISSHESAVRNEKMNKKKKLRIANGKRQTNWCAVVEYSFIVVVAWNTSMAAGSIIHGRLMADFALTMPLPPTRIPNPSIALSF